MTIHKKAKGQNSPGDRQEVLAMIHHMIMTADEAIEKLKSGNKRYLLMNSNSGNVSATLRKFTYETVSIPMRLL